MFMIIMHILCAYWAIDLEFVREMNKKTVYSIAIVVVAIISLVILKTVPIPVTEDFGSQHFTIGPYNNVAVTTLIVKKGWTVSGSYSEANGIQLDFEIYTPNGKILFAKTNVPDGTFSFVSETGGSYIIKIHNYLNLNITVTLEAKQSSSKTVI